MWMQLKTTLSVKTVKTRPKVVFKSLRFVLTSCIIYDTDV